MSVIAISIGPDRLTRIFLDCRDAPPELADLQRIEQASGQSIAMAETVEDLHREVAWRANATRDQLAAAANS
jgi:hypothetical protein